MPIDELGLVERAGFDATEIDMIRHGDMIGPTLGAKVLAAIERLLAERDEARAKVRDMHRRAQRAEGRVSAGLFLLDLWAPYSKRASEYLLRIVLGDIRRCLSRRARQALQDTKP